MVGKECPVQDFLQGMQMELLRLPYLKAVEHFSERESKLMVVLLDLRVLVPD